MIFKKLSMKNFLSVGEKEVIVDFTSHSGLTLIKGNNLDVSGRSSNGSGKSTIIEGIVFALYGKTLRKLKKEEFYINEKAKTDCVVELEFDNVKISRRFILDKKGKKKETKTEFFIDGVTPPQCTNASSVKVSEEIEKHIKISFETMCNILIFGQHNMISFLDAGEPDKREIVENLMNLKEWNLFEEKTRTQLRENKNKQRIFSETYEAQDKLLKEHEQLIAEQQAKYESYRATLNQQINLLKSQISSVPDFELIKKQWDDYNTAENNRSALQASLQQLKTNSIQIAENISKLQEAKRVEEAKKQPLIDLQNQLNIQKTDLNRRLDTARKQYCEPLKVEIANLQKSIMSLSVEQAKSINAILPKQNWEALLNTVNKELSKLEQEINSIKNKELIQDAVCPECFGPIDIKNCQHVLARKEKDLTAKKAEAEKLVAESNADKQRIKTEIESVNQEFQSKIKDIEQQSAVLQEQINGYEDQLLKKFNQASSDIDKSLSENALKISTFDQAVEDAYKEPIAEQQKAKQEIQLQIISVESQIKTIVSNKPSVTIEQVVKQQTEIELYKQQLKDKENELHKNPYDEVIKSLEEKGKTLKYNAEQYHQSLKECEKVIPYYEFLLNIFGKEGIKSFVINQIIPTLNQQVDYWMQILYQGAIKVTFDKLLNVTLVNNASNNEMVFGQGSGGERRRIDLAVMLAFRQVMKLSTNKDPNIVFFDEVAENIDEDGVYRLYDTLLDLAKSNQVYVITHNSHLLGMMNNNNKIEVKKQNGVMELV